MLNLFDLLRQLFNEITIPEDVLNEASVKGSGLPGSIETQQVSQAGWPDVVQLVNTVQLGVWQN